MKKQMVKIGEGDLMGCYSLLIPQDSMAHIPVDIDGWRFDLAIEFDNTSEDSGVDIAESSQGAKIVFHKWDSMLGTALKEPVTLATLRDGQKLAFMASNYAIGGTNKLDLHCSCKKSDEMSEKGGTLDTGSVPVRRIHKNVDQVIILTTEDKLKNILHEYNRLLEDRKPWVAVLGVFLTLITTLVTSTPDESLLSEERWKAIFGGSAVAAFFWLVSSVWKSFQAWRKWTDIDDIVERIKAAGRWVVEGQSPLKCQIRLLSDIVLPCVPWSAQMPPPLCRGSTTPR